jgi:hypothetical protein
VAVADKIWKTCCALHNMLLEVDGLDVEWNGEIGLHNESDVLNYLDNFALQHLQSSNIDVRLYDASDMGPGDDLGIDCTDQEPPNDNIHDTIYELGGAMMRCVKNMSMEYFHKKLVHHFDIKFTQHAFVWPSRTKIT